MDILLEVLKWIVIVLLAGFIGQFGKSISLHIIDYFKKRKVKRTPTEPDLAEEPHVVPKSSEAIAKQGEYTPPSKEENEKQQLKAEKKALKAQLKARKKEEKAKLKK